MTHEMTVRLANTSRALSCGRCSALIATFEDGGMTMAKSGSYLTDDGDAIPGVASEVDGRAALSLASVGRCPGCEARHWVLEVHLHDGPMSSIEDWLADDPDEHRYLFAERDGAESDPFWLVQEAAHPLGLFHVHCIGPLPVADEFVTEGRYGVSACGGGAFWQHAAATFNTMLPAIAAVQRKIAAGAVPFDEDVLAEGAHSVA